MTAEEWKEAYRDAYARFFTPEHMETLVRRAWPDQIRVSKLVAQAIACYGSIFYEGVPPLEAGILRRKVRKDRRRGLPIESPLKFYPVFWAHLFRSAWKAIKLVRRYDKLKAMIKADPERWEYTDLALTPVTPEELGELELYEVTPESRAAAARAQKLVQLGSGTQAPAAN